MNIVIGNPQALLIRSKQWFIFEFALLTDWNVKGIQELHVLSMTFESRSLGEVRPYNIKFRSTMKYFD